MNGILTGLCLVAALLIGVTLGLILGIVIGVMAGRLTEMKRALAPGPPEPAAPVPARARVYEPNGSPNGVKAAVAKRDRRRVKVSAGGAGGHAIGEASGTFLP